MAEEHKVQLMPKWAPVSGSTRIDAGEDMQYHYFRVPKTVAKTDENRSYSTKTYTVASTGQFGAKIGEGNLRMFFNIDNPHYSPSDDPAEMKKLEKLAKKLNRTLT